MVQVSCSALQRLLCSDADKLGRALTPCTADRRDERVGVGITYV
jgi:hypothetical protein